MSRQGSYRRGLNLTTTKNVSGPNFSTVLSMIVIFPRRAADMIRFKSIANSSAEDGDSYLLRQVKLPSGLKITEWLIRWIWFWIRWTSSKSSCVARLLQPAKSPAARRAPPCLGVYHKRAEGRA